MSTEPVIHAVDDDRLFLLALARTLRTTGLEVNCYSGADALFRQLDPERPGCLIVDLRMPDMDGLELQRRLRERRIRLPVIFVSGHGNASNAVAALKGGAIDFLEKPFSENALLACVQQALEKDAEDRRLTDERAIVRERYDGLTPREKEVFRLVVSDMPNKEVARKLKISPRTVEHHRKHLMMKMQAGSQAQLITMAVLCGIHELHL